MMSELLTVSALACDPPVYRQLSTSQLNKTNSCKLTVCQLMLALRHTFPLINNLIIYSHHLLSLLANCPSNNVTPTSKKVLVICSIVVICVSYAKTAAPLSITVIRLMDSYWTHCTLSSVARVNRHGRVSPDTDSLPRQQAKP